MTIRDHVWLGSECVIMKGADIGANSIIAMRSIVTGTIPPNVVAAGAPARVVRTGVTWREDLAWPGMQVRAKAPRAEVIEADTGAAPAAETAPGKAGWWPFRR